MRISAWIVIWAFGVVPVAALAISESTERPNVLFIAVDDLNDWIEPLGGFDGVKTPYLDRLADQGVLFTRAYCNAPLCNASRVSLLTGLRPSTTGVYTNSQPFRAVRADAVTLPQHFMTHGYHVVGGGKIYHGHFPDPASWHEYFEQQADPMPEETPVNGIPNARHFDWGAVDVDDAAMNDMKVAEWAIDYLKKPHDKPFFLAAGFYRPHLPWYAPRKYFEQYPLDKVVVPSIRLDDLLDIPPAGVRMANANGDHLRVTRSDNWKRAVQGYLASITFVDACIGRLMDALMASPHARNTIVILWSDHGWHLGEKLHWRKFTLWEEAGRVPMIMIVPGVTTAGARCDRTVSLVDIYPTLIDVCGLSPRDELEGRSLMPLLKDPNATWDHPVVTTHGQNNHAVRSEQWRYIRYADGSEELYDHRRDPMEWTNVAKRTEFEPVKRELAALLPEVNAKPAPSHKLKPKWNPTRDTK